GGRDVVPPAGATAILGDGEADRLLQTIRGLARAGAAVVLVTHKLQEVKRHADSVTIMRGGRTVATLDPRTATAAELTELTVGQTVPLPTRADGEQGPTP